VLIRTCSITYQATGRAVVLPLPVHLQILRVQTLFHSRLSVENEFPQDNALQTHLHWKRARYVLSFCQMNRWHQHQDTTGVCFHSIFSKWYLSKSSVTIKPEKVFNPEKTETKLRTAWESFGSLPPGFLQLYRSMADKCTISSWKSVPLNNDLSFKNYI